MNLIDYKMPNNLPVFNLQVQKVKVCEQPSKIQLTLDFQPKIYPCKRVVQDLMRISAPLTVCCWYEGGAGQPLRGANFMRTNIFEPLYAIRKDVKLYLYSLKAWSFKSNVDDMPIYTSLGNAINSINRTALECIDSSSFFHYARSNPPVNPCQLISEEQKAHFKKISAEKPEVGKTVASFFNDRSTVFDWLNGEDVAKAYSLMQYVEGFFLIQNLIERRLKEGEKKINIAFVLPNKESQYYSGLTAESLEGMLSQHFGNRLEGVEVNILFRFFKHTGGAPYNFSKVEIEEGIDKAAVEAEDIPLLFNYLARPQILNQIALQNEETKELEPEDMQKRERLVEVLV